ncbi:MAG: 50S ribosomal protein L23 [Chloroflexi bacterium]|nr:50S ribosomal protein L23 [Chloroflexota bacterium]
MPVSDWKRWTAYQSDWKKAVVTLKSGERIELFDA